VYRGVMERYAGMGDINNKKGEGENVLL